MPYTRAQIQLDTNTRVTDFINEMSTDNSLYRYYLENFDGSYRVNARSLLGAIYASAEFQGQVFLVNDTHDGLFPNFIDKYRV